MTLRKVDWLFILFAVIVVVGVSLLPTPKDRNPPIPKTVEHDAVKAERECVGCHAADAVKPVPARHPKRVDCFRCHARQTVNEDMGQQSFVRLAAMTGGQRSMLARHEATNIGRLKERKASW